MALPSKFHPALPFLAFSASIVAVFALYMPGLSSAIYYDDIAPLSRLARVNDFLSSLYFIFSDTSGPLGRPISMATFLLHAGNSSIDTRNILLFNVSVHLANGLLVAGVTFLLLELSVGPSSRNRWLAVGCATFWLILPIHVSTSLIAIQRMAGISAFFVFFGLLIYLFGISIQGKAFRRGALFQATGLGLFTLLAMHAKENGILLPILALTIETTVLAHSPKAHQWRKIRLSFMAISLAAILIYLANYIGDADNNYLYREFTLIERLQTEPKVILDYIRLAFFPRALAFSPFHDNYAHIENLSASPEAIFSVLSLVGAGAYAVTFRRRTPVLAFAILWFLAAHLLESSVIALELYFEHRNYVALFAPCFAITWLVQLSSNRFSRVAPAAFSAYLALMAAILLQVTTLWGNRQIAAEIWFMENPRSARATAHLAAYYNNIGNAPHIALRVLDRNLAECPTCSSIAIQAATLACSSEDPASIERRINSIRDHATTVRSAAGVDQMLQTLHDRITLGKCGNVSFHDLEDINTFFLRNPFLSSSTALQLGLRNNLFRIKAEIGDKEGAIQTLNESWSLSNDHGIAYVLVNYFLAHKMFDEATRFVTTQMCLELPNHPLLAYAARKRCRAMEDWILGAQRGA